MTEKHCGSNWMPWDRKHGCEYQDEVFLGCETYSLV